MNRIIVLIILVALISASGFDIYSVSTCTNVSTTGYCLKWQQNGTVHEQLGDCFPGRALVMTREGLKRMDAIVRGESILGLKNGE